MRCCRRTSGPSTFTPDGRRSCRTVCNHHNVSDLPLSGHVLLAVDTRETPTTRQEFELCTFENGLVKRVVQMWVWGRRLFSGRGDKKSPVKGISCSNVSVTQCSSLYKAGFWLCSFAFNSHQNISGSLKPELVENCALFYTLAPFGTTTTQNVLREI